MLVWCFTENIKNISLIKPRDILLIFQETIGRSEARGTDQLIKENRLPIYFKRICLIMRF